MLKIEEIRRVAEERYNLRVEVNELNGFDEQNFLLTDKSGEKYILKAGTDAQGRATIEGQIAMMNHLAGSSVAEKIQKVMKNMGGEYLTVFEKENTKYYIRILTFLEDIFWYQRKEFSKALFYNLGAFIGEMDSELNDFSHFGLHREYVWDIGRADEAVGKLKYITDPAKRRIADYFLLQFETEVRPVLSTLRHACVQNDVHDYNLLVSGDHISGLIDFGDAVYTALINNLAIACAYSGLYVDEPLTSIAEVVRGYHRKYPLEEKEIDLLYYLIASRLCISVTQSACHTFLGSHNEHHFLTEKMAWKFLNKWIQINPLKAADLFRHVCGFKRLFHPDDDYHELLENRNNLIGRNLSVSYKKPLKIIKGALQYLYDDKGNTSVDCVNNVSHIGHCHPALVRAMQKQIATLNTNTRYLSDIIIDYARELTATLPDKLKICYFVNSGSEANDLAIRMARHFTQRQDVIVLDHAYHGTSTVAMELSPYKFDSRGGSGQKPYIHKALSPDLYRGPYQYGDERAGEKYAVPVLDILENLESKHTPAAAFICETLLGVGGQIPLPDGYLRKVYEYVHRFGGVCIADEVQVGFGRVGEKFWGFELQNVEPDIVVMGKPIGNGHPLSAVVVTEEIANAFNNGLEYFNTFGGNPVSMMAGLTVLKIIKEEGLQQNALEVGNYLITGLRRLMDKFPIISDVRGRGLFIGAEMVKDRITKEPAIPEIDTIIGKMRDRGYLLSSDGPLHNVLKIKPPVVFSKENADGLIANLEEMMVEMGLNS